MSKSFKYPNTPISFQGCPQDLTGLLNLGYHTRETTQRYVYGTRGITWDGKVFRYCLAESAVYAGYGAFNGANATIARLINSVTPAAYVAGQRDIKITIAATEGQAGDGVIAEDELAGARIVLGHGGEALTESRTVVGNDAVASNGGTTILTLDYPLALAHDAGVACELPLNPYRYLHRASTSYASVMCVPNLYTAAAYNFWGQTKGMCWCVPGGSDASPGDTAGDRMAYFIGDGSVNFAYGLAIETGYQLAGYCVDTTASGSSAMPTIMLMLE